LCGAEGLGCVEIDISIAPKTKEGKFSLVLEVDVVTDVEVEVFVVIEVEVLVTVFVVVLEQIPGLFATRAGVVYMYTVGEHV
jgi:hypothetical protein